MGRIGEHGIADLLDAVGSVMPCLVHEVGVGRDREDLAAGCLERIILVREVLELGRADKGEICGVEEEYAPLAEDIGLADGLERVIDISLYGEIRNFLVDQRHSMFSFSFRNCVGNGFRREG